ncbi:acetylornithine deacetylase [Oceaniovalibus guishaninsula JLT2003]|uniref:Acetylornithine deacetylase n=1 Tax=Oceaniovalibus guishaninsula JLT2003 TaxID=1231392 RepID=K2GNS9_9RHOB|nr:acetylornithine deacetylase [Oceaniovalibus guishaninsula]EKE44331.1 acetylornithine deacetylase [Oceaniovalibus guishaninsula JLT2003]
MDARAILDRLVAFPTVSRDSNLDLIDWVEGYLKGHGVTARRVPDATGRKAALYANIGPEVPGGVVLSGHTDVVPVDGQDWTTDPFAVTERDGRFYGRGTCDMKGFIALALAAVPDATGLKRPLQIALSYDEEVGCLGAPPMIDDMAGHLPQAAAAIIGEPSMMRCVTAHKGGIGWLVHVHGHEVHSSLMDRGVSAVMEAASLIEWANDTNARLRAAPPTPLAAAFDPPFTTVHVGTIRGGTAHNITARDCEFGLSFRVVPGEDPADHEAAFRARVAEIEARMQAVRPETRIEVAPHFYVPALRPEQDGAAEALVRRLTGDNGRHVVSYGTEAGQFQERGHSAAICGPGDIAQAHQPDEYIEVAQFRQGAAFVAKVIESLRD